MGKVFFVCVNPSWTRMVLKKSLRQRTTFEGGRGGEHDFESVSTNVLGRLFPTC